MRIHHPGPVTLQLLVQRRNHRTIRPRIDILPEHRVIHQSQRKPLHKIHKLLQLQIRQLNPHLSALLQDTVRHSLHTVQPVIPTLHTPAYYHTSPPAFNTKNPTLGKFGLFYPFSFLFIPFYTLFPQIPHLPTTTAARSFAPPPHSSAFPLPPTTATRSLPPHPAQLRFPPFTPRFPTFIPAFRRLKPPPTRATIPA